MDERDYRAMNRELSQPLLKLIIKNKKMGLFKSNWSKWQPITVYTYSFEDYILLGRINIKNGDVKFKSRKIHGRKVYTQAYMLFDKPLNATDELLKLFGRT